MDGADISEAFAPRPLGRSSWMLRSYEHVRSALADPQRFSSNVRGSDNEVFRSSPLVFDDPPRHTELRRLVMHAFTPRRVADTEPWIRDLANALLDDMGSGPVDFIATYADPLPVLVIARMLGVPGERHRQFKQWSIDRAYVTYHSRGERTPELVAAEAGCREQEKFLLDLAIARRAQPGDDLISALATAEVDGTRLDIDEVAGTCSVLLSAGNLTTTRLLGNVVADLAQDPKSWNAVRADPALVDTEIERSLRVDSPVQTPIRRTATDVDVDGTVIPAGAFVTMGVGIANTDPRGFGQPHLAFGHGIHYCLGAALARLEAAVTLRVMSERFASLGIAEQPVRETSPAHRGYSRLVLTFR